MSRVCLGLGTNLGDRRRNLEQAVQGLAEAVRVTAVSPVYESEPWGIEDQPQFLNLCLVGQTDLSPHDLLTFLKQLEKDLGREKTIKWGPRLIDIDILFYDDRVVETDRLTIPHPFMTERAFVLAPLADIVPDFVHPRLGQTVRELAANVDQTTLHQLPEPIPYPVMT